MEINLFKYIDENFPDFWSEIYVRFELGEPYDNGTDERINQVNYRVVKLFEDTFEKDDSIYLYIIDWEEPDIMFGNTTPNYIYELLDCHALEETIMYENDQDLDMYGNSIQTKQPHKVKIMKSALSEIPYKEILEGIANYEQGRKPKIGQRVYFININKDIIFNMYDDRGCIIFAKYKESLRHLYNEYNDWFDDYWRSQIDKIFKE